MTLSKIGPYTIDREVGRGGMGVVYRGEDTRLKRPVAIKMLPEAFARDPERLARFEREARLLASLTHPNVAGIYGLEEADGQRYLILEFVEGETLAERLKRGPLPVDETIDVCRQIAGALESAHEAGVIHRDLKPGNVKITPGGDVKVLDFGLARGAGAAAPDSGLDLTHSPTVTLGATGAGVILGTAAYMSPEQARGRAVDRRTDIWAFGCVLYECLTGEQAFAGETVSDMIALILQGEPDGSKLPRDLPQKLRTLLIRCLEKDPRQRLRDIGDARIDLEELSGARPASGSHSGRVSLSGVRMAPEAPAGTASTPPQRAFPWIAIAALVAGLIGGAALWNFAGPRAPAEEAVRFMVQTPQGSDITADPNEQAISPDGRTLAIVVVDSTGQASLSLRSLAEFEPRPLPDTRGAALPFWSPDGAYLGFFADGKLKRIRIDGGRPEIICDASTGRGASWSPKDVIVFGPAPSGPLFKVRASGGTPEAVTAIDSAAGETAHRWPNFLPDGEHFIYAALPARDGGFKSFVGSLGSMERTELLTANGAAVYAEPGYVIFHRNEALLGQRFATQRRQVVGDPFTVGDPPGNTNYSGSPGLSVSRNGVLTWLSSGRVDYRFVWRDRAGREVGGLDIPPGPWGIPVISPDGRSALVEHGRSQSASDVWVIDLDREIANRLTFGAGKNGVGPWSPDGREFVYTSTRKGPRDLYRMRADGSGGERLVYESAVPFKDAIDWSPDGQWLAVNEIADDTGWNLYTVPAAGGEYVPYVVTPFNEQFPQIAPNGRYAVYVSDESGTSQVYIQTFPEPGQRQQVTRTGAFFSFWGRDGSEIFVIRPDGMLLSVPVSWTPEPRLGQPVELFVAAPGTQGLDVAPDGQRFLCIEPANTTRPGISVAVNWRAGRER